MSIAKDRKTTAARHEAVAAAVAAIPPPARASAAEIAQAKRAVTDRSEAMVAAVAAIDWTPPENPLDRRTVAQRNADIVAAVAKL